MAARQHKCSICLNSFKNPKFLPCYHSFCYTCLEGHVRANLRNGKFICPMCNTSVELPNGGVKTFQTNFYIETDESEGRFEQGVFCGKHPGQDIQLVCQTCNVCMCLKCKALVHDTHPSKPLAKAAAEVKRKLKAKQSLCDEKLKNINKLEQEIKKAEKGLNENEEAEIGAIEQQHLKILSTLNQEVIKMKDKVKSAYETIRRENEVVTKKVRSESKFYTSAMQLIDEGSEIEIFKKGTELERRISEEPLPIVSLKNPRRKFYRPAGIEVRSLGALIGTMEEHVSYDRSKHRFVCVLT